jgi:DNA-binding GntR family transcriptional regulator
MSMPALKLPPEARRLDSVPLSEHVYQVIRDAICDGVIKEHDHLVQNQLAEQLEVSRTPVRDALLRLAQEGLVRAVSARGFVVKALTPSDILEIYEVRTFLEVPGSVSAIPFVTDRHVARLEEINRDIATSPTDAYIAYDLNRDFHAVLLEIGTNRLIQRTLADLWELPVSRRVFRHHVTNQFDAEAMANGHLAIIEAVAARSAERLRAALLAHLVEAREEASTWLTADALVAGKP